MHLSISSSSQRIPCLPWALLLLGGLTIAAAYVFLTEGVLAAKGYQATVQDGPDRWMQERLRARELGRRALILVGASRVQLDFDLAVLRDATGLEPVQLAIDGSSFVPILEGLANDPEINGTVLVGIQFDDIGGTRRDASHLYQENFDRGNYQRPLNYGLIEARLGQLRSDNLRNFSDGARPWDALHHRLLNPNPVRQYLVTYPDRSRAADYQMVPMPSFYLARVMRNLGEEIKIPAGFSPEQIESFLAARIDQARPSSNKTFLEALPRLETAVRNIQTRGGRVIFVVMPMSGLVKKIEDKRYPRKLFWDPIVTSTFAMTIHFEDHLDLAGFVCPDGSHLDQRDRPRFTNALARHMR
ncbi:MAG: hypothetical protein HY850_12240 [Betaproteobacteria bacterium]|nr:hypothetical protein [Betaproteobacteria bacterium]